MAPVDLAIVNGRLWTGEAARGDCSAVAVRGDRIVAVGSDADIRSLVSPSTEVIDANGASVLPGFVDAHNHVRLGFEGGDADLTGATSLTDIRQRVARAASRTSDRWIVAEGWNPTALAGRMPVAADLDGLAQDRPLFLISFDVHSVWLNRQAMVELGIERGVDRLPFATVDVDPSTGTPTGLLRDFAVLGLAREGLAALEPLVPYYRKDRQYARLCASLDMAVRCGITTLVEPQNSPDDIELFQRARREGRLHSRVVLGMMMQPGHEGDLAEFAALRGQLNDDRLSVGAVKLYADDVIEPHTAAFFEPYANAPHTCGHTFWEQGALEDAVTEIERAGFPAFIHATGDRGISAALDAFEAARRRNGPGDRRHQVVHVECPRPADIPRFAELGVVACMQPRHAAPELTGAWRESVGPERARFAWPLRSLQRAGAVLALSSDWNVAEMDPLVGIFSALTRSSLDGGGAWATDQTLDLDAALRGYTWGSAYSIFAENDRGILAPGRAADIVVLSEDLLRDPPSVSLDAGVRLTVRAGEAIFTST